MNAIHVYNRHMPSLCVRAYERMGMDIQVWVCGSMIMCRMITVW